MWAQVIITGLLVLSFLWLLLQPKPQRKTSESRDSQKREESSSREIEGRIEQLPQEEIPTSEKHQTLKQEITEKSQSEGVALVSQEKGDIDRKHKQEQQQQQLEKEKELEKELEKEPEKENEKERELVKLNLPEQTLQVDTDEQSNTSPPFVVGSYSNRGTRKKNEDRFVSLPAVNEQYALVALFDGHGGSQASDFCEKKISKYLLKSEHLNTSASEALKETFLKLDEKFLDTAEDGGTTAVACLVDRQTGDVTVAHAGDSRAVLYDSLGHVVFVTEDHKPNQEKEKERIERSGIYQVKETMELVSGQRKAVYRIDGQLAVSRAIGDSSFKEENTKPEDQALSALPDLHSFSSSQWRLLVVACDGLWDVMTHEDFGGLFQKKLSEHNITVDQLTNSELEKIAQEIVTYSITELQSGDNVTLIILVKFKINQKE